MTARRPRRSRRRNRRPRWVLPLAGAVLVLVVALGVLAVVGVLHAIRLEKRLSTLPASIQLAQVEAENGQLGQARGVLAGAEATLSSVNSSLFTSPDLSALRLLPVARQNLDAVRSAVQLGLQMVGGAQEIFNAAAPLEGPDGHLDVSLNGGQVPLATIQAVQAAVSDVATGLPVSPTAPGGRFVLGRVRRAADKVYAEAVSRRTELSSIANGLSFLNEVAGGNGDRRYLIAVANEAEMRGAGGMILSYGVLTGVDGKVSLAHFGPIDEIPLKAPASASLPTDVMAAYSQLQPTEQWRQATLFSDFKVDGPVLASMYQEATGQHVDGVIQVDSDGLGALLEGTGPVTVPALGQVDAANVVPLTLNQAYVQFPDRPVRQEYLGTVAQAAITKLTTGNLPSVRRLGQALLLAASQRHILMYTSSPSAEATVAALGFTGALPGAGTPFAQLTVQNIGGDKMDYYLDSSLTVTGARPSVRPARMTMTIDLHDTAPAGGAPPYIFGPYGANTDPPGTYRGLVTLYLPHFSYLDAASSDPAATTPTSGTLNQLTAISFYVDLPPGGQSRTTLTVTLPPVPPGSPAFTVVPTPRVRPTAANVSLR